jgi:hypothetical protein
MSEATQQSRDTIGAIGSQQADLAAIFDAYLMQQYLDGHPDTEAVGDFFDVLSELKGA